MEAFQRLQALDFLLVIIWALVIAWGVASGVIRQLIMLVAVYFGAIAAGQGYAIAGVLLSRITGPETVVQMQLLSYLLLFVATVTLLWFISWRVYPHTALVGQRRLDAIAGGVTAAIWGLMLLIWIVGLLLYFTALFWPAQEPMQVTVQGEIVRSQLVQFLRGVLEPLWNLMQPWFPLPVRPPS